VLRVLLRDEPLAADVNIASIASATEGYSGSDLEQLCKTTAMSAVEELLQAEIKREEEAEERRDARREELKCDGTTMDGTPQQPCKSSGGAVPAESSEPNGLDELDEELSPLPPLRRLTLDDFLRARAVVRPTRGRFEGVDHGLGVGVPDPVPAEYDESLYD
tara:strand:- start:2 stop:487 length:486 start_codon:yes stop_codon:yes gene_type:complete